ncbi:RNA polymerase sigma factor [Zhouia amylolytica]|uniref:RNA polymerase sigma factor n=1 Tax=Zhouia amylolytica TaxID=376730 RepID=UPI0020CE5637|nr:sigma-70 family RNA polymerase sigma factor [Zhouia amylolytica]
MKLNDGIVSEISNGNYLAFKSLFDNFFTSLCLFSSQIVKSNVAAQDIAQEALIAYWKRKSDFEELIKVKAFLYITTKNLSLNYLKKNKKVAPVEVHTLANDKTIQELIIKEEVYASLREEIDRLPPRTRKVLQLALQGMKNPEIALQLNVSVNTVKTLKKNAYAEIREAFGGDSFVFLLLFSE